MKRYILLLVILFYSLFAVAQKPLSNSRQSSRYTYYYKLSDQQVELFYKGRQKRVIERLPKAPVDSFKTDKINSVKLAPGNYLEVSAQQNNLRYVLKQERSAHLRLLDNQKDLQFLLYDLDGNEIKDAVVTVGNKIIMYDHKSELYRLNNSKKDTLIKVKHLNTTNFYNITRPVYKPYNYRQPYNDISPWSRFKQKVKSWFGSKPFNRYQPQPTNPGYMVLNKPMYKPGDTVKLKAFIVNKRSKTPINNKRILVRLKEEQWDNGKVIGYVDAYKKGAFEYEFKLSDSLKLSLDDTYYISLESLSSARYDLDEYDGDLDDEEYLSKRTVYQQSNFKYEDYELKVNKFVLRTDKNEHLPGNPISVYFKATDENGLNVMDGRVEIVLKTQNVSNYASKRLFVPDTLWQHKLLLDNVGETKLVIPDSIFPKANVSYMLEATFLNSNNEQLVQSRYMTFRNINRDIQAQLIGDTLKLNYMELGQNKPVMGELSMLNSGANVLQKQRVSLPAQLIIRPDIAEYVVKTDSVVKRININQFGPSISASGYRTVDSIFISVNNPRKINFKYSVFEGKNILTQGSANAFSYKQPHTRKANVSFLINYVWADQPASQEIGIPYQDKVLTIDVQQPLSIYPGQQADIQIKVKDAKGRPVPSADITAYSFTKKFENYSTPFIPYLGKEYTYRKLKNRLQIKYLQTTGSVKLNWQQWAKSMGLDSIEYYKFTHPASTYQVTEPAPGNVTQIAPFIVKDGDIVPVHLLFIDERPVYFSKTNDLQRYSFKVDSGKHKLRFRTSNRYISMDNVYVSLGKKLIISIADTSVNQTATFTNMPDTLLRYEADLINKYLINIEPNFENRFATLEQDDKLFLFTSANQYRYNGNYMLAGPLNSNVARFNLLGEQPTTFIAEPGYSYLFGKALLKQKSLPVKYPFDKKLTATGVIMDYRQYALSRKEIDTLWQANVDFRSANESLFRITNTGSGKLIIRVDTLPNGTKPFVKNIIVYKSDELDFVNIYAGNTTYLGNYGPGKYRLFYLLKGNTYYLQENVIIKPNGNNYYATSALKLHDKDSVSISIAKAIEERITSGDLYTDNQPIVESIKETFNDKYLDPAVFTGEMSGWIYSKDDKLPLPGVSVRVKGMASGTHTNASGYFSLKVPASGRLVVSFIGYMSQEVNINPGETTKLYLKAQVSMLNEVVVTGYGTQKRSEMTGSVSTVTQSLSGRVAGIQLRGNSSYNTAENKALIIVDSIIYPGTLESLSPDVIADISVLNGASAVALYGARASNGALVITTKKKALVGADGEPVTGQQENYRRNFSDYAYWQPRLKTDQQGNATFKVIFPDDITNWRTFVIGMTDNRQSGFAEGQIKSYKPLSAAFNSPLFAIKGDVIKPLGKISNYTTDTISLSRKFSYNAKIIDERNLIVTNSKIDTFKVVAEGKDSLTFEYAIKRNNGYFDGERRILPLFEQGVIETKGTFDVLERDTALTLHFDPKLNEVTFRAEASVLPALLDETEHLRTYQYLCNEQLASKLKGLLAEKRIKAHLGESFKWDKDIKDIIKKLQESRRREGTWGWWKDTDEELWISLHAAEALVDARLQGYAVVLDEQKLADYLLYKTSSYRYFDKLNAIKLLLKLKSKANIFTLINAYENEISAAKVKLSTEEKYRLMLVKQQAGMPIVIDSLLKNKHSTMFGNVYWGEQGYRLFNNSIQQSLLAYQILKQEGRHPELLAKLRYYFLEERKNGYWRNTYESSLILETILPDLLINGQKPVPSSLALTGGINQTITKFPYTATLANAADITVQKTGSLPVYVTAYQKFWNSSPKKVSKDFTVNTWFEKKASKLSTVKGGESITLKAEVIARADADFVMVEIPIPAGCSYESKDQSYLENEVHREHYKNKVSIFCRKMTEGKHVFSIKLVPRYGGSYHVNPAKAEMMYFPVFYGREGMKKLEIQ